MGRPALRVPINHPCWSRGMSVFVEDAYYPGDPTYTYYDNVTLS